MRKHQDEDSEDEDLLEVVRQSLQANDQWKIVRNRRKEKRFRAIGSPKEVKSGTVGGSSGGVRSGSGRAPKGLTPTVSGKRTRGKEPCRCCSVGSLIEMDGVRCGVRSIVPSPGRRPYRSSSGWG